MESPGWHKKSDLGDSVAFNIGTSDGFDDLATDTKKGFWYWTAAKVYDGMFYGPYRTKDEAEKLRRAYIAMKNLQETLLNVVIEPILDEFRDKPGKN